MSGPERPGGTLLALVRAAETGPGSLRAVRTQIQRTHQLTASYLGLGFLTVAGLVMVRGVFSYSWSWNSGSAGVLTGAAWLAVIAAFVAGAVSALLRRGELGLRTFTAVMIVDAAAFALEIADSARPGSSGVYYPSICVGVGATLLGLMAFHPLSRTYGALGLLLGLSVATLAVQSVTAPGGTGIGTTITLLAVAPTVFCAMILSTVDEHVHRKLDRTLTDSMIDAPGTGPGSLAASELASIDGRVEELLARISGGAPGGLDERTGEQGRLLGDELRSALARSHDRTWLRIALDESAHLSGAVVLDDPDRLAASLLPPDRARMLSVLWLLTEPSATSRPGVEAVFRTVRSAGDPPRPTILSIGVTAFGTRPRELDSAVWGILGELGAYRVHQDAAGTAVRLEHSLEQHPRDRSRTP
ncbi:hypothetical protein [Rathayibacter sp. Leaf296]|uniref:hypothetical protein n=1 Tax=Rathayibacter sp. Leaf296 TaxID=1736327 RepID=UPI00070269DF|nr:hypothetical protein [Rathayibacter sp. Leaf296]KQQ09992.1 hypothetical protein ASF46_02480 [Rathayibacter sp. Leaf296]